MTSRARVPSVFYVYIYIPGHFLARAIILARSNRPFVPPRSFQPLLPFLLFNCPRPRDNVDEAQRR